MIEWKTETPIKNKGTVGNGILGDSPLLRSAKRALRLSPTTPVGLARKLQLCDQVQSVEQITFEEEDFDLISIGYTQNKIRSPIGKS